MEDTWESSMMLGVGINDMRGLRNIPPSCSEQIMPANLNHQNMQHHQDLQPSPNVTLSISPNIHENLTHGLAPEFNQGLHNHHEIINQNNYFSNQLLVAGQTTTHSAPSPASGGSSLSPGGSASGPCGALSPGGTSNSGPTQCCESGRPLVTDPLTGQSVCSCQYDPARLALQYPRTVGVYGAPYPSTDQNPYPSIGVDSSAFYSPLSTGSAADMSAWTSAGLQPTTGYYPYDPTLAAYGYGAGYDLAARRKNATRESTATLKAWLNEHKKNPYPTKGEKIMLAIITKMTLTQVSTWFANARRRLKKENKMTWEPKNKTDDDDDAMVSDNEDKDKDDDDDKRTETDIHGRIKAERNAKDMEDDDLTDEERKDDVLGSQMHHMLGTTYGLKAEIKSSDCGVPLPPSKPKIWSLADTAACKTPPPPPATQQHWSGTNGFALPSSARYSNGGFLSSHCQPGFAEVQTDTPPQTPPNMKLPSVTGNLLPGQGSCLGGSVGNGGYSQSNFLGGFNRLQSPQRPPQQPNQLSTPNSENAAFKPFYKSPQSMNGGFVSPV